MSLKDRREYKHNERESILNYIINSKRYDEVKGRTLWQDMENDRVCNRTWQSMKEHFRRKIINMLDTFNITEKEKKSLLIGAGHQYSKEQKLEENEDDYVICDFSASEDEIKNSEKDSDDDVVICENLTSPKFRKKNWEKTRSDTTNSDDRDVQDNIEECIKHSESIIQENEGNVEDCCEEKDLNSEIDGMENDIEDKDPKNTIGNWVKRRNKNYYYVIKKKKLREQIITNNIEKQNSVSLTETEEQLLLNFLRENKKYLTKERISNIFVLFKVTYNKYLDSKKLEKNFVKVVIPNLLKKGLITEEEIQQFTELLSDRNLDDEKTSNCVVHDEDSNPRFSDIETNSIDFLSDDTFEKINENVKTLKKPEHGTKIIEKKSDKKRHRSASNDGIENRNNPTENVPQYENRKRLKNSENQNKISKRKTSDNQNINHEIKKPKTSDQESENLNNKESEKPKTKIKESEKPNSKTEESQKQKSDIDESKKQKSDIEESEKQSNKKPETSTNRPDSIYLKNYKTRQSDRILRNIKSQNRTENPKINDSIQPKSKTEKLKQSQKSTEPTKSQSSKKQKPSQTQQNKKTPKIIDHIEIQSEITPRNIIDIYSKPDKTSIHTKLDNLEISFDFKEPENSSDEVHVLSIDDYIHLFTLKEIHEKVTNDIKKFILQNRTRSQNQQNLDQSLEKTVLKFMQNSINYCCNITKEVLSKIASDFTSNALKLLLEKTNSQTKPSDVEMDCSVIEPETTQTRSSSTPIKNKIENSVNMLRIEPDSIRTCSDNFSFDCDSSMTEPEELENPKKTKCSTSAARSDSVTIRPNPIIIKDLSCQSEPVTIQPNPIKILTNLQKPQSEPEPKKPIVIRSKPEVIKPTTVKSDLIKVRSDLKEIKLKPVKLSDVPKTIRVRTDLNSVKIHPRSSNAVLEEPVTIRTDPDAVTIRTDPDAVTIRTDPDAVTIRTDPDAVTIRTDPDEVTIRTDPDAVMIRTDPDAVTIRTDPDAVTIRTDPDEVEVRALQDEIIVHRDLNEITVQRGPDEVTIRTDPDIPSTKSLQNKSEIESITIHLDPFKFEPDSSIGEQSSASLSNIDIQVNRSGKRTYEVTKRKGPLNVRSCEQINLLVENLNKPEGLRVKPLSKLCQKTNEPVIVITDETSSDKLDLRIDQIKKEPESPPSTDNDEVYFEILDNYNNVARDENEDNNSENDCEIVDGPEIVIDTSKQVQNSENGDRLKIEHNYHIAETI